MSGIFHIRPVSVGLESQIWYLFIYITRYLDVRKISETMGFRTFVVPLLISTLEYMEVLTPYHGTKTQSYCAI